MYLVQKYQLIFFTPTYLFGRRISMYLLKLLNYVAVKISSCPLHFKSRGRRARGTGNYPLVSCTAVSERCTRDPWPSALISKMSSKRLQFLATLKEDAIKGQHSPSNEEEDSISDRNLYVPSRQGKFYSSKLV